MRVRVLLALALSSIAPIATASLIHSTTVDPVVVRLDRTAPVLLTVVMESPVSKVRLDFAAIEGSISLQPAGNNVWRTNFAPAPLLAKYQSDDVGRLLVGSVKAFDAAGAQLVSGTVFLGVLDPEMGSVATATLSSKQRITRHILNILRPGTPVSEKPDVALDAAIAKEAYSFLKDDYDFLNIVFALPSFNINRGHYAVRDETKSGIQPKPAPDTGADYGSPARLLGLTKFPHVDLFDLADSAITHELGHQWVQSTGMPIFAPGPHWPHSTMARDIMGTQTPSNNQGIQFPWDFEKQPDGSFRWIASPANEGFNDFDLYLMGLIPASQVAPQRVALDDFAEPCEGCPVATKAVTVNDIIAALGPRVPDAASSQKNFQMATVVLTQDRLLTDDELSFVDYFARRARATTPLDVHNGFQKKKMKPWHLATRGLSTIDSRLTFPKWLLFILNPPTITKVPPSGGPIKINAQGLKLPVTVKVDGIPATRVRLRDEHTLTFVAPPHRRGPADIVIIQGRTVAKLPNGVIYE